MKKFLSLFLVLFILVGCQNAKPTEPDQPPMVQKEDVDLTTIKVLSPMGPPSISTLGMAKEGVKVEYVAGPDLLQAAMVNANSEYDAIIAPINLGVALASKGKTIYQLSHVISWGNLKIVAEQDSYAKLGAFGQQAIGKVVEWVLQEKQYGGEIVWYPNAAEAQVALLAGEVDAAVLVEPVATATINKAKKAEKTLMVVEDLSQTYAQLSGFDNFPQAALFIKEENVKSETVINLIDKYLLDHATLKEDIEAAGNEMLGIPAADLIVKLFDELKFKLEKVDDHNLDQINHFLKLLNLTLEK